MFLCNVYHHLRIALTTRLYDTSKTGLHPHGRLVIIAFYHDERSGPLNFPKHYMVARERVIEVLEAARFRLAHEQIYLPKQYCLEFTIAPSPS